MTQNLSNQHSNKQRDKIHGKVTLERVMQQVDVLRRAENTDNILLEARVKNGLFNMLDEYKEEQK